MTISSKKILFVDDDPNILDSIRRQYGKKFHLETALGGAKAVQIIHRQGPFAVIVSDMRMPEMDGVTFLSKASSLAPDTVRMVLTGHAGLESAIEAVNMGYIFRFLTKPCPPEVLTKALTDGIRQYQLVTSERDLLEKTLRGTIALLAEVLSLVNPTAFSQSIRIRRYVHQITTHLNLNLIWEYEVAAMLSQIGSVTLPPEVLSKVSHHAKLDTDGAHLCAELPRATADLLSHIPRLETVGRMIAAQNNDFHLTQPANTLHGEDRVALGGHMLRISMAFDHQIMAGTSSQQAFDNMLAEGIYDPEMLAAFHNTDNEQELIQMASLPVTKLEVGMVLDENVHNNSDKLLALKGQEITKAILMLLQASASRKEGVKEPILVHIEDRMQRARRPVIG